MPQLLLLDESFSGLDRALRFKLIAIIRQVQIERPADRRMPVIAVTHDIAEILATADAVVQMRNGGIVAQGTARSVLGKERAAILDQLRRDETPGAKA